MMNRPSFFCADVTQVAFEIFGYPVGLATIIATGLGLTVTLSVVYRLATRYTKKRYRGIPE